MTNRAWPFDAVSSAPSYTGRALRQTFSPAIGGAAASRPFGGRSGVRPNTSPTTVTASSTVWTVAAHAGVLDVEAAVEAGVYWYALDATDPNNTGAVTAANATNPRKDGVYIKLDDPAEADGSSVPVVKPVYVAGTSLVSGTLVVPGGSVPARSMLIAEINVPIAGGGSPTVSWKAPIAVAAGGIIPVRTQAERDLITFATTEYPVYVDRLDLSVIQRNSGSGWVPISASPWRTYSPALSGYTGTVDTARWIQHGGLVTVRIAATVTAAVGTFRIPVPTLAAAAAVDQLIPVGTAVAVNTGAGSPAVAMASVFLASTSELGIRHSDTGEWNTARPFGTWASGYRFALTATFEPA